MNHSIRVIDTDLITQMSFALEFLMALNNYKSLSFPVSVIHSFASCAFKERRYWMELFPCLFSVG